ncbi:hypothetical protein U1Q18_045072 [Sarracenia purpurea var. burkii]
MDAFMTKLMEQVDKHRPARVNPTAHIPPTQVQQPPAAAQHQATPTASTSTAPISYTPAAPVATPPAAQTSAAMVPIPPAQAQKPAASVPEPVTPVPAASAPAAPVPSPAVQPVTAHIPAAQAQATHVPAVPAQSSSSTINKRSSFQQEGSSRAVGSSLSSRMAEIKKKA